MAATRSQPTLSGPASGAVAKAKEAGDTVATAARRAPAGALAAGAAAAGLAGGLVLGARATPGRRALLKAPKVLGVRVGRRRGAAGTARAVAKGARRAATVAAKASSTAEDIRAIRQQLEHANRRSPIEIVLDGLTHRRGAHKLET
jgi:hypothetical protein